MNDFVDKIPHKAGYARDNFKWEELECKCGCGTAHISDEALDKLQLLRTLMGTPLHINSAARCPSHNKSVGGKPHSRHLSYEADFGLVESTAFDINTKSLGQDLLIKTATEAGFKGIGRYKTFVHVDVRDKKAHWEG